LAKLHDSCIFGLIDDFIIELHRNIAWGMAQGEDLIAGFLCIY
jgi:hypothetical protein